MGPLDGIRILDLSRLLPGPYCTLLLADLGAEVIKVETPGLGDYIRIIPPFATDPRTGESVGSAYLTLNRNKKSLALNFRNKRGRQVLLRLAQSADVIIESFRPGAVERWGIDYTAMRAVNPRIVYCSLSGYGQSGPYRDRAGHDLNYIALAGVLAANGAANGKPLPPAVQIADMSGGMLAAMAVMAAVIGREKTGRGQHLDVSLFDGALSWAGALIGSWYMAGKNIERGKMQLDGGIPCYQVYETRDGKYIALGALEPHLWAAFCAAVGREDLVKRHQDYDAIPEVVEIFRARSFDEWVEFSQKVDACIEPVREFGEALSDPQARHRGVVTAINGIPQIGSVFAFAENPYTPPPRQGEHTHAVLTEIGLSPEEIEELAKAEIIKRAD